MAAMLAHTPIRTGSSLNSHLDATMRLSRNPYLAMDYSIQNGIFYKSGISGKFSRNEVDIYNRGKTIYELDFLRNSICLNFSEFYLHNMKLQLGTEIDIFYFIKRLSSNYEVKNFDFNKNNVYVNYF